MAKRSGNRLLQSGAADAGRAQARQAAVWQERERAERSTWPLSAIYPRPGGNSRPLKPAYVVDLAESIAAVGLIEPPVIDREGCLLAGAHRVAALRLLTLSNPEDRVRQWLRLAELDESQLTPRWRACLERLVTLSALKDDTIAVMVLPFNAADDPSRALAIETSENTQRRSYSRDELLTLVQRLREAGFVEREGRPKLGEKALRPALSIILGKSSNTVRRWLGVLNDTAKTCPNGQGVGLPQATHRLRRAIQQYRQVASAHPQSVSQDLMVALDQVESLLSNDSGP